MALQLLLVKRSVKEGLFLKPTISKIKEKVGQSSQKKQLPSQNKISYLFHSNNWMVLLESSLELSSSRCDHSHPNPFHIRSKIRVHIYTLCDYNLFSAILFSCIENIDDISGYFKRNQLNIFHNFRYAEETCIFCKIFFCMKDTQDLYPLLNSICHPHTFHLDKVEEKSLLLWDEIKDFFYISSEFKLGDDCKMWIFHPLFISNFIEDKTLHQRLPPYI